jgi:acetyl-CoA/propionyl-CoA carboxylase biotin carboxyl carrier protein
MVTGLDLIREQVLIAAGRPMSIRQEDVEVRGHSFECRINAENPSNGFLPSPGLITHYKEPTGIGVRVDSGVEAGSEIAPLYDPMIAKLIVHDTNRETARRRMLRALDEFEVGGVKSLLGFHRALLRHQAFIDGGTCHGIVESELLALQAEELSVEEFPAAASGAGAGGTAGMRERSVQVELNGRRFDVKVQEPVAEFVALGHKRRERELSGGGKGGGTEAVTSPMQGTMLAVKVAEGDTVMAGQVLCIIEAMKMENEVAAHRDGIVEGIATGPGQPIKTGQLICRVVAPEGAAAADA